MPQYNGFIIGGCPNGLTPGCYLAKEVLKILVLEKRYEMGGGLCSEMITIPGCIHNKEETDG
jgi:phytoene dehydrogenase-like protein